MRVVKNYLNLESSSPNVSAEVISTNNKRVLIIAYFFPPDGGGGTQRPAKFCKYLAEFGWMPSVLTRSQDCGTKSGYPSDASLAADIGEGTSVHRVAAAGAPTGWARSLPRIDIAHQWLEPAATAAADLCARQAIQLVLITMSPFDLSFLGRRLANQFGIPVVYDLRDPWALDGWRLHGTRRRWQRDWDAMVDCVRGADGVIANTPESERKLLEAVPQLKPNRVVAIPNGFDAADFSNVPRCGESDAATGTFKLLHVGVMGTRSAYEYRGILGRLRRWRHYRPEPMDATGRSAYHLLKAIHLLRRRRHPLGMSLRLELAGSVDEWTRRSVEDAGLTDCVEFSGYHKHTAIVEKLCSADALFLPLHGLAPGYRSLIVPGKTYEYLASGRPILGCLPPGDARELVERSGRGFCADPCDPLDIARALEALYEAYRMGRWQRSVDTQWLAEFERRALTGKLASFLDQILSLGTSELRGRVGVRS